MSAQEFEVDGIYYNITSWEDKTVEVKSGRPKSSGVVTIPQYVVNYNNGDTYRVTSIGERAFKDCDGLTSVKVYCLSRQIPLCPIFADFVINATNVGESLCFKFSCTRMKGIGFLGNPIWMIRRVSKSVADGSNRTITPISCSTG